MQYRYDLIENFEPMEDLDLQDHYDDDRKFYEEIPTIHQNELGELEIKMQLSEIEE